MITSHLFPKLLAATGLLALGACAAPNWTTLDQQAFTIRAACERQHDNGQIATELDTERCANPVIHRIYADSNYPQMDVLDQYLARREAIANAVDRKTIAPSDAPVKLAEAETEQVAALQAHHLDPVVYNTAPYRVMAACPRYSLQSTLCN